MGISDEQLERLIAAQEANTNAMLRLVRFLEDEQRRKLNAKAPGRSRRTVKPTNRPVDVTPLVEAKVRRALAELGEG